MHMGYCRVSTEDQNPDLQLAALQRAGCTRIFTNKATGVHVKRPQLTTCLTTLQAGDVLIVWKLDHLGWSLHDLITLNWLRVFRRAKAAYLCSGVGPKRETNPVPSEKCVARWGSEYDEIRMIPSSFARVPERCTGHLYMHFS